MAMPKPPAALSNSDGVREASSDASTHITVLVLLGVL